MAAGADMNKTDIKGVTPLLVASRHGYVDIVKLLIGAGADPNGADNKGVTPVLAASESGHESVVKVLLKSGVYLRGTDEGDTPLSVAAQLGHEAIVKILLEVQAGSLKKADGTMPIHLAAEYGHEAIVTALVRSGADVNIRKSGGASPLLLAAQNGHDTVVNELLKAGAEVDAIMLSGGPENNLELDSNGDTALLLASQKGHHKVVNVLLRAGADMNRFGSATSHALAQALCICGWCEGRRQQAQPAYPHSNNRLTPKDFFRNKTVTWGDIFKHSIHQNGPFQLNLGFEDPGPLTIEVTKSVQGTPLFLAAQNGHLDAVNVLINAGADVDKPCRGTKIQGRCGIQRYMPTPLFAAAQNGHGAVVDVLLDAGANACSSCLEQSYTDKIKRQRLVCTPLGIAAKANHVNIVKALFVSSAKIDLRSAISQLPDDYRVTLGGVHAEHAVQVSRNNDADTEHLSSILTTGGPNDHVQLSALREALSACGVDERNRIPKSISVHLGNMKVMKVNERGKTVQVAVIPGVQLNPKP